jgi:hypothetical protein
MRDQAIPRGYGAGVARVNPMWLIGAGALLGVLGVVG